MRAVCQRVSRARVTIGAEVAAAIGPGLCVLLGVAAGDGEGEAERLAAKIARLRIFAGEDGRLPDGIPATEFLMLVDRDGGRVVEVLLFETEDDLRRGDETMSGMSPGKGSMHRVAVDRFEVPVRVLVSACHTAAPGPARP